MMKYICYDCNYKWNSKGDDYRCPICGNENIDILDFRRKEKKYIKREKKGVRNEK